MGCTEGAQTLAWYDIYNELTEIKKKIIPTKFLWYYKQIRTNIKFNNIYNMCERVTKWVVTDFFFRVIFM